MENELRNYEDHEYDDNTREIKEIIDGKIYYMSRGTPTHVRIITRIAYRFNRYFDDKNKGCEANTSDLDVYLDKKNENNYVEPDISIICDDSKFFSKGYKGAPELIVEVASPKTRKRDRGAKFRLFEKAGVKEYWIVEPDLKSIEQYVLENGIYSNKNTVTILNETDAKELTGEEKESYTTIIKPTIFDDLEIDVKEIFLKTDV